MVVPIFYNVSSITKKSFSEPIQRKFTFISLFTAFRVNNCDEFGCVSVIAKLRRSFIFGKQAKPKILNQNVITKYE